MRAPALLALVLATVASSLDAQAPPAVREGRALRIGMIGAGAMGGPIGLGLAAAGHQVVFSSRNPGELLPLVQQAAPRATAAYSDAAAYFADVVILATPPVAFEQLGRDYGALMRGKIVIDISNPRLDREGPITNEWLARGTGVSMAEFFPGTRFVKALNTVAPRDFANPLRNGVRVGVPIASDDAEAARVVMQLVRDLGLDPVIAGPLARAKEFDRGTSIWETGASAQAIREALGIR
ncbi:MAG: NADP oxidoreductase [Gemmatimonadetes bacterium]|nr:NADP oxidoreductase [Gemmatimonadota bacterium]